MHDDDDDDDDDDDKLLLWNGWPTKSVKPYVDPGPAPQVLTRTNFPHAGSKI